jgi:hypothetical protein
MNTINYLVPTEIAKLVGAKAEIAALKQGLHRADEKLAEAMLLAKFGAMVMRGIETHAMFDALDIWCLADSADITNAKSRGYAPGIEATIEQLLKD